MITHHNFIDIMSFCCHDNLTLYFSVQSDNVWSYTIRNIGR